MKLDIFKQKWLDMVFEGRNKSYGAYELRKKSPKTTLIALAIGAGVFFVLLGLPLIWPDGEDEDDSETVTMVDMAKLAPPPPDAPILPPPPPPPPAPKIDEVKFVKPEVVKKEEVVEEIKTIEELKDKNVGSKDVKGRDDGVIVQIEEAGEGDKAVEIIDDSNKIYTAVEVRPDFPGGINKFYEYVGKNYRAPEGEELNGRIMVQFVVEKDGSLTDIKVLRDLGFGTAKEAERVLKRSPKWKPGIQNGRPVRVYYTLPIIIKSGG